MQGVDGFDSSESNPSNGSELGINEDLAISEEVSHVDQGEEWSAVKLLCIKTTIVLSLQSY